MNNEPVAWMGKDYDGIKTDFYFDVEKNKLPYRLYETAIPLYTHPAKTLTDEIEDLKNELMMEEESYMLLNESFLFAKESIKQQQIKIKELETKTLTDAVVNELWAESQEDGIAMQQGFTTQQHYFAYLILRKAQEK